MDTPFDIGSLDTVAACNAGAEIELRHPVTAAPLGVYINILGRDSEAFREHTRQSINERIRRDAVALKRGKDTEVRTLEQSRDENIDLLVVCTMGWRTGDKKVMIVKGEELPFNVPNAKRIYGTVPWIYEQINEAIGDLANFMKD